MKIPKEFELEKDSFYLLESVRKNKSSLCFTDKENYLIGRYQEFPTWIWNKNKIKEEKIEEIKEILKDHYLKEEYTNFTCKKELYEALSQTFPTTNYFEMGFLSCKKVKEIEQAKGFMDTPTEEDREVLKKYWKDFNHSIHEDVRFDDRAIDEEVDKWYKEKQFFLWRNNSGKVVSIACFRIEGKMAKLSHVYTPVEERRKGYCASLIASITKMLLEKGYEPMLYTDFHYEASNHAYEKVGYQLKTVLINFKMKNL